MSPSHTPPAFRQGLHSVQELSEDAAPFSGEPCWPGILYIYIAGFHISTISCFGQLQAGNCKHAEDSINPGSESSSSGHRQQQSTAKSPSDQSTSSEGEGFWQKQRHGKQHQQQQQQSATGTWDFDTAPGEHETGQPSSSASSHNKKDKQMLYIQVPAQFYI